MAGKKTTQNYGNESISSNPNYSQWDYIYDNETIDISYLLNASMWDRFFLSTIPQNSEAFTPMAGMRMPNTRLFLTSIPEDTKDLNASETAFEEAASHIGIDGAFNVNSTSYEAWRFLAFLNLIYIFHQIQEAAKSEFI